MKRFFILCFFLLFSSACTTNTYSTITSKNLVEIKKVDLVDQTYKDHFKTERELWYKILNERDWNQYIFYTPEGLGIETLTIESTSSGIVSGIETEMAQQIQRMNVHIQSPSIDTTIETDLKSPEELYFNYANIPEVQISLDSHYDYLNEAYQKQNNSIKSIGMSKGRKTFYQEVFSKCSHYLEYSEKYFTSVDLPKKLSFLTLLESGCDPQSVSNKTAVGIWQMIPETAQKYGLIVNETLDERFDPIKETEAAGKYLSELLVEFQYPLWAVNAYHSGEGNLRKAKTWAKEKYPNLSPAEQFEKVIREFPQDSTHNTEESFFYGTNSSRYTILFSVVLDMYETWEKEHGKEDHPSANWWKPFETRKSYAIELPHESIKSAYMVKSGDTLTSIASEFFLTLEELQIQINRDPRSLKVGENLEFEHPYFEELGNNLEKKNKSFIIENQDTFCSLNPSIVGCKEKDLKTLLLPNNFELYY